MVQKSVDPYASKWEDRGSYEMFDDSGGTGRRVRRSENSCHALGFSWLHTMNKTMKLHDKPKRVQIEPTEAWAMVYLPYKEIAGFLRLSRAATINAAKEDFRMSKRQLLNAGYDFRCFVVTEKPSKRRTSRRAK